MIVIVNYLEIFDFPAGIRLQIKILSRLVLSVPLPQPPTREGEDMHGI